MKNPILTTITPYRGRPTHLRTWLNLVARAKNNDTRHALIVPGGMSKDEYQILFNHRKAFGESIEVYEPEDIPHGIMTIGHWHNWAAKNVVETPWIMKLDIDCMPHEEFFSALVEHVLEAKKNQYFNVGFFKIIRAYSNRFDAELNYLQYTSILSKISEYTGRPIPKIEGSHFVCRTQDYLDMGGCLDSFVGYGWEDYQQLYGLERLMIGSDPLRGIVDIHNVTQRCRDEISRPRCNELFESDNRLALLHKWHGYSTDAAYKINIEHNRKVLLKYVLDQKAHSWE